MHYSELLHVDNVDTRAQYSHSALLPSVLPLTSDWARESKNFNFFCMAAMILFLILPVDMKIDLFDG